MFSNKNRKCFPINRFSIGTSRFHSSAFRTPGTLLWLLWRRFFLPLFLDCWIFASGYCDHYYCEEDFFYLYFLIVGLLHLVIDHYCEEEDFFFLSLFILGFFYLIIVARWENICKNQIIRIFDDNNFSDYWEFLLLWLG